MFLRAFELPFFLQTQRYFSSELAAFACGNQLELVERLPVPFDFSALLFTRTNPSTTVNCLVLRRKFVSARFASDTNLIVGVFKSTDHYITQYFKVILQCVAHRLNLAITSDMLEKRISKVGWDRTGPNYESG
jgi:hypothetical protein